jgi:hypothetical protein
MHNVKVSKIMIIFESVCMNVLRLLTKNVKHTEQIKRAKTKEGTLMSASHKFLSESSFTSASLVQWKPLNVIMGNVIIWLM